MLKKVKKSLKSSLVLLRLKSKEITDFIAAEERIALLGKQSKGMSDLPNNQEAGWGQPDNPWSGISSVISDA